MVLIINQIRICNSTVLRNVERFSFIYQIFIHMFNQTQHKVTSLTVQNIYSACQGRSLHRRLMLHISFMQLETLSPLVFIHLDRSVQYYIMYIQFHSIYLFAFKCTSMPCRLVDQCSQHSVFSQNKYIYLSVGCFLEILQIVYFTFSINNFLGLDVLYCIILCWTQRVKLFIYFMVHLSTPDTARQNIHF